MSMLFPPFAESAAAQLHAEVSLQALCGQRIVAVRYVWPETWTVAGLGDRGAHDVAMGVELVTTEHRYYVAWNDEGYRDALEVHVDRDDLTEQYLVTEASGFAQWRALLPATVERVSVEWHDTDPDGVTYTIWWLTLTLSTGEVALALGTLEYGHPTYLPDAVLVLFDAAEAGAYLEAEKRKLAEDGGQ